MYWLFVDDERDVSQHWPEEIKSGQHNIVVTRTYDETLDFIDNHWEEIEVISLDHDLGELGPKTGYDIACYIELTAHDTGYIPKKMLCHSANPVGWKKIMQAFSTIEKAFNNENK